MNTNALVLDECRRTALLNAALKEFAVKGYELASTNRIAKEAGLSKPLMFHYVGSKQELFFFVYNHFSALLNDEYYKLLDCTERDLLKRLHQSYLLQLRLLYAQPWIFDFYKMCAAMDLQVFDEETQKRLRKCQSESCPALFEQYDSRMLRQDMEEAVCIQIIYSACKGFADLALENIRAMPYEKLQFSSIEQELDSFFKGLRQLVYTDTAAKDIL